LHLLASLFGQGFRSQKDPRTEVALKKQQLMQLAKHCQNEIPVKNQSMGFPGTVFRNTQQLTTWVAGDFPLQVYRHREVEISFNIHTYILYYLSPWGLFEDNVVQYYN